MTSASTVLHDEVPAEESDEGEPTAESSDEDEESRERSLDDIIDAYAE